MPTREEHQARLRELADLLEPPPPPPPPPPPSLNVQTAFLTMHDVNVPAGATKIRVPITLSEPSKQSMVFRILTQNGTAREGPHFARVDQYLSFEPGEQAKLITINVGSMVGLNFRLNAIQPQGWSDRAIPRFTKNYSLITGSELPNTYPLVDNARSNGLIQKPAGLNLAWEERFSQSTFAATDTGFLSDGVTPCWRTCMGNGDRFWPNNGTIGLAVDPALHPNAEPWLWDSNGVFTMQSERKSYTNVYNGTTYAFNWTMPFLTTQRFPVAGELGVGDYIEGRMAMPLTEGSWPALWLLGPHWPDFEADLFEAFNSGGGNLTKVGTTVHWRNASGSGDNYGIKLPQLGITPNNMNTWGMYWGTNELTFFCNDQPYMAVPNIWPADQQAYLKLDIAVGGAGGQPDPVNWPVRMPIEWVRVWR